LPELAARERLRDLSRYDFLHRRGIERALAEEAPTVPDGPVLDVGCGLRPYADLFGEAYVGIDYTTEDARPDARASALDLPVRSGAAAVVLSTQYLEHADDPAATLTEMRRVLRDGGTLLLSTHGVFPHHGHPRDFWRWTEDGLVRQIEAAGFQVRRVHRQGDLVSAGLLLAAYPLGFESSSRARQRLAGAALVALNGVCLGLDRLAARRAAGHYAAISYLMVATASPR
jgi:SAM-dependent methyltransferase